MTNKKRLSLFFSLLIFIMPLVTVVLSPKVLAAVSGTWVDNSTIRISGGDSATNGTYIDVTGDHSSALIREGDSRYCVKEDSHLFDRDEIDELYKRNHVIRDVNDDKTSANLNSYEAVAVSQTQGELSKDEFENMSQDDLGLITLIQCIRRDGPDPISLSEATQATLEYRWLDEAHIEKTDGKRLYVKDGTKFIWTEDDNSCKEYISTSSDTSGTLHYDGDKKVNDDCEYKTKSITLGSPTNANKPAGSGVTKDGETTGDVDSLAEEEPSCESGGGEWSWILCPALRITSSFVGFVDQKLNELLTLPSSYYESRDVELAWSRMRNIAYAILIPIMLIMILATALGFDFVSAYTFKKAMPRLVVAILFIALSLEITQFLIVLTNDVGQGILGLITSAFSGAENITLASLFDPGGATGALATGGALVGGIIVVGGLIPVLLLFLASAGLALLVALLALALRQMLLIAFMVIAPLAILAWIFPGNDKLWKLWWNAFTKLLILFPLIMFLIGSGRAFAALVQSANSSNSNPADGDFLFTVLKLVAYVGPYFFIPAMFKFAGGIFATLTGMANDRSKGVFDRLRNARHKQTEKAWHRAKEGNYFKGGKETGVRGALNKGIMGTTLAPQVGLRPKRMKDRMRQLMGEREVEESEDIMKSTFGRMLQDDDIASALIDANGDEAAFRRILEERADKRFKGPQNKDAMEAAVANMRAMGRQWGAGGVRLAALRSKFNSSTGWNNEYEYVKDENGNFVLDKDGYKQIAKDEQGNNKIAKYNASGLMLEDINKVAGANRILSTQLLAEARAGQSRAGREDTGGGGFSDTAVEMDKLHRGDMVDVTDAEGNVVIGADGRALQRKYTIEDATEGVTMSLINGKNIYELFRSGKPAVARAVAPVLLKRTQQNIKAAGSRAEEILKNINADSKRRIDEIQADTSIAPQEREVRVQAVVEDSVGKINAVRQQQSEQVIQALAQEQMAHAVAATSSADVAKEMGDKVFNVKFDLSTLPPDVREKVEAKSGPAPTHGEVYEALRSDPTWKAYTKEYGASEFQAGSARQAALAAGASQEQAEQAERAAKEAADAQAARNANPHS